MKYRQFGNIGWQASILGFGCMRLPTNINNEINEEEASEMIHFAIENGVNYFDTAYFYHQGESETFLGEILSKEIRKEIKIATKLPSWLVKNKSDLDKYFNEQLKKLNSDYIDFYLLHMLNKKYWSILRELNVIDWLENIKKEGKIGHIGFSFHDDYKVFSEIIDEYDWEFCQIQYNYIDITYQAGIKGLHYATDRNIPVIVMEPLLGGRLADSPGKIQKIWNEAQVKRKPVDWALKWLWDQPEVTVVLSGMNTFDQVKENIHFTENAEIGLLTSKEKEIISKVRETYQAMSPINCTRCKYCIPCPQHVDIPTNFKLYNEGKMYDVVEQTRKQYAWMEQAAEKKIDEHDGRAIHCIKCGACDEKCPQSLPISKWIPIVHEVLGNGKTYEECPLVE